jgi:cephalosporin hydroxylase
VTTTSGVDPKDIEQIRNMAGDREVRRLARELFLKSCDYRYSYNFCWLGRPVIQYPQDIIAIQEILWGVKPELVIETGVAHGGSLMLSASILELLGGERKVLGIDIDIRPHNRSAIENHRLANRIQLLEGSSIDPAVLATVHALARGKSPIVVILDSNHTHDHVLRELECYSQLVKKGAYLIVMDTVIEDMPKSHFPDRPWGPGNNPKTAVREFLSRCDRFETDVEIEQKLLLTVAPEGYLRCVKD